MRMNWTMSVLTAGLVASLLPTAGASEKLVAKGQAGWRFLDTKELTKDDWTSVEFDDSQWKTGNAPLGYGEEDVKTTLSFGGDPENKHPVACFRLKLDVKDPASFHKILGRIRCDDGAVVYVNGKEVQRLNVRPGTVTTTTNAAAAIGPENGDEQRYFGFLFDPATLRAGQNVLAVSLHQANGGSSDLFLDLEMYGLTENESAEAQKLLEQQPRLNPPNDEF